MFHLLEKMDESVPYIIAEMSANHLGKLENALEIVKKAAEAGADCVKIQTYTADTITMDCDGDLFRIRGGLWDGQRLYDLYQSAETPWEWQEQIQRECWKCGVDFLSTPFDFSAVDFLSSMGVEAYKIASFELVDLPLIEYAAAKGKPMLISCGMGSEAEIQEAVDACRRQGNEQIVLLKCCSQYPTNWENMHLSVIPDMRKRFGCAVGLSDHSPGSVGAIVGVALGAKVIEKHFCLSRALGGPDSAFSMEPEEFAQMVRDVRNAARTMGTVQYGPEKDESSSYLLRRSLFAVKEIPAGAELSSENVRSIRPSGGMAPKYYHEILGRRVRRDVQRGEPLHPELLDDSESSGK